MGAVNLFSGTELNSSVLTEVETAHDDDIAMALKTSKNECRRRKVLKVSTFGSVVDVQLELWRTQNQRGHNTKRRVVI